MIRPLIRTAASCARTSGRRLVDPGLRRRRRDATVVPLFVDTPEVIASELNAKIVGLKPGLRPRRGISSTARALHGHDDEGLEDAPTVEITWQTANGEEKKTEAKCGMNLMRVAHAHGIDLEGACEGVCACSTCHVILSEEVFESLPEPSEDEDDMLDLAFGLTETSRLGCQVVVTEEMDGILVKLPPATRNFYVDGHVPQPH